MAKPLNEFGGWLRFFYLTNIIGLVISVILLIMLFPIFLKVLQLNNFYSLFFIVSLIEIFLFLFIIFRIVKTVSFQEQGTPHKISKYLFYLIALSTIFLLIKFLLLVQIENHSIQKDLSGFREFIGTLLSSGIWILYFRKSKRVNAYYGKNAGKNVFKNE